DPSPTALCPLALHDALPISLQGRQLADDQDLLPVDGDVRRADEPAVGQPALQPRRRVLRAGQIGLLPAAAPGTTPPPAGPPTMRSEEHTSELQSLTNLVCRL